MFTSNHLNSNTINSNSDTTFLSVGGGGKCKFWLMAAVASPSTPAVVFTALAGVAIVAVIFYGASSHNPSLNSSPPPSPSPNSNSSSSSSSSTSSSWTPLRSVLFVVSSSSPASSSRSPFNRYDLGSTKGERDVIRTQNRKQYEKLRRQCRRLIKQSNEQNKLNEVGEISFEGDGKLLSQDSGSASSDDAASARESLSSEDRSSDVDRSDDLSSALLEGEDVNNADASTLDTDFSDSDSSEGPEVIQAVPSDDVKERNNPDKASQEVSSITKAKIPSKAPTNEDFSTWQRIIRLDAVRANAEWMSCYPSQASVSESRARRSAEAVGLKDYGHLEPGRIFHAARLVAILEAYALYDSDIGYCQGMSDLLSPIVSVISEDHEAFWCFVGFMKKARQNFRLDEVGIRRQLDLVAKIIKFKDAHLFRHLEKLQAEDCFFVYRMVVVMFRRELTFEQTLCLWEVMWADQAAIRAGIGKSSWSRIRQRAPPTEDLLLYAIAASVLQRRKLIIEKYSSMDEIIKECNSMSGHLDVWKLLDDAHNLVVILHDKVETSFS
ncbi:hypothetical protein LR48_Vigan07g231100 [Vigna angularis]|uniref:Rab-GAP TBC domain-containing protein n=1 Tax=Phaseolus angularis TaxID=3914 RepID=A0A0L9V180_PHAAN|nr:uncharacterized protein HKW66_Vig0226320 [Vigna angularis]KOM48607.1 hypothetical protein LR48_Vigan07g231100 [Vigna angularis]